MKVFIVALAIVFSTAPVMRGQKNPLKSASESVASRRIQREILNAESQLKQALTKCNTASLNRLLADYFADSFGDSEKAVGKRRTIDSCESRAVPYYSIAEHWKLSVRGELVVIEGIAKRKVIGLQTDIETDNQNSEVRVQRTWTKQSGRWLLVSQWTGPAEEERDR
jgi:hypothetical protein